MELLAGRFQRIARLGCLRLLWVPMGADASEDVFSVMFTEGVIALIVRGRRRSRRERQRKIERRVQEPGPRAHPFRAETIRGPGVPFRCRGTKIPPRRLLAALGP